MKSPALKAALAALVLLILAAGGWRAWMMYGGNRDETVLQEFQEPGDGPRAPSAEGFGVKVGTTTLEEVNALAAARGWRCEDTSVRALMQKMRENKRKELAEKKAAGEEVDEESGASWLNKRSPKERNPQVRLACADTRADAIGDRERPTAQGRLLFVFDSPELPLRHASYRRLHRDHEGARQDFEAALASMKAGYGEPTDSVGEVLAEPDEDGALFPKLQPIKREWNFSDVQVKVNALNFGKRGVDILESVEVPLPVRPDAPADPR